MRTVKNARGMDLSLTTLTRNKNADKDRFIYDLNIFQREQLNSDGEYAHFGPWYIHIYEYTGNTVEEVSNPVQLTYEETSALICDDPYFLDEVDVWYGLEGFMKDKWDVMSDSLKLIFETLPKYKKGSTDLPTLK
jgi:hypothetical protein